MVPQQRTPWSGWDGQVVEAALAVLAEAAPDRGSLLRTAVGVITGLLQADAGALACVHSGSPDLVASAGREGVEGRLYDFWKAARERAADIGTLDTVAAAARGLADRMVLCARGGGQAEVCLYLEWLGPGSTGARAVPRAAQRLALCQQILDGLVRAGVVGSASSVQAP